MSACRFFASDYPLPEFAPSKDNYFLQNFAEVDCYSKKRYGVSLEWRYTDGRAKQLTEYIKK